MFTQRYDSYDKSMKLVSIWRLTVNSWMLKCSLPIFQSKIIQWKSVHFQRLIIIKWKYAFKIHEGRDECDLYRFSDICVSIVYYKCKSGQKIWAKNHNWLYLSNQIITIINSIRLHCIWCILLAYHHIGND